MKRIVFAALAAAVMLAPEAAAGIRGYATAPRYVPDAPKVEPARAGSYEAIRSVAVVSAVGDTLALQYRAPTGTRNGALDVATWKLDRMVEAYVRSALAGRFRIAPATDPMQPASLGADSVEAALKTAASRNIDALVVIKPGRGTPVELQTVEFGQTILWVDFEMDVIDAHSRAVIAHAAARLNPPGADKPRFPGLIVGRDYQLDRTLALAPQKQANLHLLTQELAAAALSSTMESLKLKP